jgi:hypothetical protein
LGTQARAQTTTGAGYINAVGLGIGFGNGDTGAGIDLKHFFTARGAVEANLLFYNSTVSLGAYYEYNGPIQNAPGLQWYLGPGPQFFFHKHDTDFGARPMVGLDYKVSNIPLDFSFDWRPYIRFTHDTNFNGGRFQLNIRFVF